MVQKGKNPIEIVVQNERCFGLSGSRTVYSSYLLSAHSDYGDKKVCLIRYWGYENHNYSL